MVNDTAISEAAKRARLERVVRLSGFDEPGLEMMQPVIFVAGAGTRSFRCCLSDNSNARMLEGDGHGTRANDLLESGAITAARRPRESSRIRGNPVAEGVCEKSNTNGRMELGKPRR